MYAATSNMIERFGERDLLALLSDRTDQTATTVDEALVDVALADAAGIVDTYLGTGGYVVPLVGEAPSIIVRICCDLAFYSLSTRIATAEKGTLSLAEKRRNDVLALLERISTGDLEIKGIETEDGFGGVGVGEKRPRYDRVFDRRYRVEA